MCITPEHNVKQKCYSVTAVCDEAEQRIVSAECEYCAAHLGGCKHAMAFIAWLHRRSEAPSSTSIDCYWKKSKLSTIGTTLKYIRAKELGSSSKAKPAPSVNTRSLLPTLINHSKCIGHMESQLMKYYKEKTRVEKLSIHHLVNTLPKKPANSREFINYCRSMIETSSCNEANLATIDQNDCPLWHEPWYARITASKMHEAAHCKVFEGTLCESIMAAIQSKDTKAMKRGRLLKKSIERG
ncbi:uncharacterized protein [Leptinotarsa decemlineata]|uniref:uncharacterized protein n=1 Tax=Leptinotarsa decemlineata TaxID=7539 RepID=UPI003D30A502